MKKTLKLGFGRQPQHIFNLFFNISSGKVNIDLSTKIQPHSLLNHGDS